MKKILQPQGIVFLWVSCIVLSLGVLSLATWQPVEAQCGASASSCKNCHEVNAKHPVNTSGQWHIKHAFGDFCSFCHGGDVQATDKTKSHQGMYYPLTDVKTACQSCHPTDTQVRANVYAVALGVDLNKPITTGSNGGSTPGDNTGTKPDPSKIELKPIAAPGETAASGALIDYNRRYEIDVLHIFDGSQTGNVILAVLAVILLFVGAILTWHFEHLGDLWKRARAYPEWYRHVDEYHVTGVVSPAVAASIKAASAIPTLTAAAPVSLSATLANLDDQTQAALRSLLADPEHGKPILRALSQLDVSLIESLQNLDRKDRALLIALVEKLGENKT